jgi:putative transposase
MGDPKMPRWQHWAQFRFAVIGGLLSSPPEGGQLQQELQALAEKSYQHPFVPDKRISPSFSTIERWYYHAKDAPDPIAALGQKLRADAGQRWAISEPLKAAIASQYHAYPRWTVQLHYDNLVALTGQQPQLIPLPSYKTVLRCMRENGWTRRLGPSQPTEGQSRAQPRRE